MESEKKENLLEMHPNLREASVRGSSALSPLRDEGLSESSGMTPWGEQTQCPPSQEAAKSFCKDGSVPLFCKILIKQLLFVPLL